MYINKHIIGADEYFAMFEAKEEKPEGKDEKETKVDSGKKEKRYLIISAGEEGEKLELATHEEVPTKLGALAANKTEVKGIYALSPVKVKTKTTIK